MLTEHLLLRKATEQLDARYLVVNRYMVEGDEERYILHGVPTRPTLYKTLKNARLAATTNFLFSKQPMDLHGIVLRLDLALLPVVRDDAIEEHQPGFTCAAFAERQAILWAKHAEELLKR